ncbi:MAG: histidinol-phosphate transaminase [Corynebacterium sp.]|nr:histidinol-phosphate transaminase [Corynebacterium sp.]
MIRPDLHELPDYVPGRRQPGALKLSSNETNLKPHPAVAEAIAQAATEVNRYPDLVAVELREALAKHLGMPDMNHVAVGVGSSALLQQMVQMTCSAPTDEVIYPWRSFEAYPIFTKVHGATQVPVPLTADQHNDLSAMAEAITENTKLIWVCNPNNPTGTVVRTAEFEAFMDKVPSHVVVGLDEAYFEYVRTEDTPNAAELVHKYPNLLGLRTFSKAYGLAGLRVGYAFGNPELIRGLNKVALPFAVSSITQAAAVACLSEPVQEWMREHTEVTAIVRTGLVDELSAIPTQSNFVWLPGAADKAEALAERGVLVRAFPEGLRITVTDAAEAARFVEAWEAVQ